MKKYFTIFMAVLCLATFSISDASAKTRKKTMKTKTSNSHKFYDNNYIIYHILFDDNNFDWYMTFNNKTEGIIFTLSSGEIDEKYKIRVRSWKGKRVILETYDTDFIWCFEGVIKEYSIEGYVESFEGMSILTYDNFITKTIRRFKMSPDYD